MHMYVILITFSTCYLKLMHIKQFLRTSVALINFEINLLFVRRIYFATYVRDLRGTTYHCSHCYSNINKENIRFV